MSLLDTASLIVTPNGYKEGKLYSVIPSDGSGDMSVTRATTATRVNSAGLVELVPYNLFQYSSSFSNAYWTKYQSSVMGGQSGYDGSTNAFLLTDNSANDVHILQPSINTSGQHTISIYAKANSLNWVWLRGVQNSLNVRAWFNLSTGTIGNVETNGTANIESVGNGWYRCSLTIANQQNGFEFYIGTSTGNNVASYSGTGKSIFVQDAQLVEGSTAKPYQKTETRLNIPRLDYSNGTCPSLLVEPQRTNRILWSEEFTNAAWSAIDTTISANTTISPEGIQNADTMAISSSTSRIFQYTGLGAGTYTASVYVKALSGTPTIQFRMVVDGADITDSIPTTTEWVRHDFTFTASASMYYFVLRGESGTGSVAIWGAQLEAGNYATSYIKTTSASVTRNADVISKTGISSLIGQTEGVLFIDADVTRTAGIQLGNSTAGNDYENSIQIAFGSSSTNVNIFNSGAPQFSYASSVLTGRHKIAIAYKANDFALYIDGAQVATDNSGSIPSLSGLFVNHQNLSTSGYLYNAVALWKTRLTNDQLTALTTI